MKNNFQIQSNKGFTLIELIIYAALLVIITFVITLSFIQIVSLTSSARKQAHVLDNAKRSMDVVTAEVKHAVSVYDPTSVFGGSSGQLSLETKRDLPTGEDTTYVDLYLDGGALFLKRDGQASEIITSEKVEITNMEFTKLNVAGNPAIRTELTIRHSDPGSDGKIVEVSLVSTTSLRSF